MTYYFEELSFEVPSTVYEPSEDSVMLANFAKKATGAVLDLGCGCGLQSIVCAKHNPSARVIGVDINSDAVFASRQNAESNGVRNCEFFISDMFYALSGSKFDYILFNPPYLPTAKSEKIKGALNQAVDGGIDGRKTIDRFLGLVQPYINPGGKILMLDSSLDNTDKTIYSLVKMGFDVRVLQKLSIFFETLSVLEATAPQAEPKKPENISLLNLPNTSSISNSHNNAAKLNNLSNQNNPTSQNSPANHTNPTNLAIPTSQRNQNFLTLQNPKSLPMVLE